MYLKVFIVLYVYSLPALGVADGASPRDDLQAFMERFDALEKKGIQHFRVN
jgi:hypothetical protein